MHKCVVSQRALAARPIRRAAGKLLSSCLALAWVLAPGCDCGGKVPGAYVDACGDDGGNTSGDGGNTSGDGGNTSGDGGNTSGDGGNGTVDARPANGKVVINEVVAYPIADWSHTSGGLPYDGPPGTGDVSSTDEYIEFLNLGPDAMDLTDWTLSIIGSDTTVSVFGMHGTLVFSPGSSLGALQPGGFVVLGNPNGFISSDTYLVLRNRAGLLVDDVEIGGLTADRDREGDGVGDGAPSPDRNGFARGLFEQAIARPAGAADTDDDQADFVAMIGTPLHANIAPPPPPETDPPGVIGGPTGASFPVTGPLRVLVDETVDPFSTDPPGVVTVTAGGEPVALGFNTFEDDDATIVINPIGRLPFDRDVVVTVRGGAGGVTDRAGNPLPGDVVFTVHTEPAPADPGAVIINEICASPEQDWSDSSGGDGAPFSDVPGTGELTPSDEWVELYVQAPGPLDVSGYRLIVYNGPTYLGPAREVTTMAAAGVVVRVTGASGTPTSVVRGDRVVIGNPVGVVHANTYISLRSATGQLIDEVEVGGVSADTDRGGDGVNNGAPEPGKDGSSMGLFDETVARVPDGTDTGDDISDFAHRAATIGAAN